MEFEFKFPDLGEGVHEGEIVRWLVSAGDMVAPEQPLVEVMTDKVTAELPSPVGGKVLRTQGEPGDLVRVGAVLVSVAVEAPGTAAAAAGVAEANGAVLADEPLTLEETVLGASIPGEAAPAVVAMEASAGANGRDREGRGVAEAVAGGATVNEEREAAPPLAVPAVRRLAKELQVDLARVNGSGAGGRIVEGDVRAAAGEPAGGGKEQAPSRDGARPTSVRRIPLRGLRRVIAEHMLDAHRNTAPYTFVEEVDFTELVGLRERVQPLAEKAGIRLTYLPFILAAVGMALREHPSLNATVDAETGDLLVHPEQHVGMAVHTDEGLVAPVIRNVEQRNLLDMAREIERLSQNARLGRLHREDMLGGTFTVTSLGALGGIAGTPMLNTPQVAVLAIHKIAPRPVVRDGNVVARQTANLSLTLDHRHIDGYVCASFAQTLKQYLEDPALMLFWLAELRGAPAVGGG